MKEWVVIQDARDEGFEDGLETGLATGREEGREEGRGEGREEMIIRQVCRKLRKGKEIWQIADELEEDEARIKAICDSIESFAPDYDEEQVIAWMRENESVSS